MIQGNAREAAVRLVEKLKFRGEGPMSVLVVMEQAGGVSLETLAAGRQLAEALGMPVSAARFEGTYTADAYTAALESLVRRTGPAFVLFPHTYQTRDLRSQTRRALRPPDGGGRNPLPR